MKNDTRVGIIIFPNRGNQEVGKELEKTILMKQLNYILKTNIKFRTRI